MHHNHQKKLNAVKHCVRRKPAAVAAKNVSTG
jgi:hypothetical protein